MATYMALISITEKSAASIPSRLDWLVGLLLFVQRVALDLSVEFVKITEFF
jgi:hypothetical protein